MLARVPRIELQSRDIEWARKLNQHGPLPTPYLLAYAPSAFFGAKHRLKDLCDGGYFYKPIKQHKVFRPSINDPDVYACDEAADDMLIDKRRTVRRSQSLHRFNLHHELFLACATASIELTTAAAGAEFLAEPHPKEMPCHIDHTGRVWEKNAWAPTYDKSDKSLVPDAYFAIKRQGFIRYFLEVDCATEPIYRTNLDEKSWRATLLKYIHVFETGSYKNHFKAQSPAIGLLLFSRPKRMEAVQELLLDLTNRKGKSYLRFKTWQDFDKPWFIPKETNKGLVEDPWVSAGTHAPVLL
jgi:hypothetical protein